MSDRFHPVCGHHGDYVMGIGDNMYCGICKIERQAKRIEELEGKLVCKHVWTNEFGLKPFHCIYCGKALKGDT